jgi:hypothetical protein
MSAAGVTRLLGAYQRRAALVAGVRAGIVVISAALLIAELAALRPDLMGAQRPIILTAVLAIGLSAAVAYARAHRPTPTDAARRIDRTAHLQDLVVTAVEREGAPDPMSAAVARAADAALRALPPARVYPIEPPSRWRRWAVVVAAAQVVAIILAWRAPDARPMPTSSTTLSLPAGASGPGAANTAAASPAAGSGAAPTAATPRPDASGAAVDAGSGVAGTRPTGGAAAGADASSTDSPVGALSPLTPGARADATPDARNRYRQSADVASDVTAHRRVPAARRGVVQRYFTAIRIRGR